MAGNGVEALGDQGGMSSPWEKYSMGSVAILQGYF